ncbi:hypothetical protein EDB19DRAFT_1686262 [Suillus lakei]|nr:hypothetical protein EDB19DRAFT_1686262 [Suillus lakei]
MPVRLALAATHFITCFDCEPCIIAGFTAQFIPGGSASIRLEDTLPKIFDKYLKHTAAMKTNNSYGVSYRCDGWVEDADDDTE